MGEGLTWTVRWCITPSGGKRAWFGLCGGASLPQDGAGTVWWCVTPSGGRRVEIGLCINEELILLTDLIYLLAGCKRNPPVSIICDFQKDV